MKKIVIKQELVDSIKALCTGEPNIVLASLCTKDGFAIRSTLAKELKSESDKLAAMSSTVSALSDSSSKLMFKSPFSLSTVETELGNILYISTSYLGLPCVLTIAAKAKMPLALARYKTKDLAEKIAAIAD